LPLPETQQEICKIFAILKLASYAVGRPRPDERNQPAAGIGLQIVVITHLELTAPNKRMPASDHRDLGGKVPLGIVIINGTLALAAGDQRVAVAKAWRKRRALNAWNEAVVGSWPTLLSHIKSGVNG